MQVPGIPVRNKVTVSYAELGIAFGDDNVFQEFKRLMGSERKGIALVSESVFRNKFISIVKGTVGGEVTKKFDPFTTDPTKLCGLSSLAWVTSPEPSAENMVGMADWVQIPIFSREKAKKRKQPGNGHREEDEDANGEYSSDDNSAREDDGMD